MREEWPVKDSGRITRFMNFALNFSSLENKKQRLYQLRLKTKSTRTHIEEEGQSDHSGLARQ